MTNYWDGNWPEEKISHSEQSIQYYRMSYELQEFLSYGKNYDNKDLFGMPGVKVHYKLSDNTKKILKHVLLSNS